MKLASFKPQASEELVLAAAWYEERREGLAETFVPQVKRTMHRITENPARFPRVDTTNPARVRRAPVFNFPFFVVYQELDDEVRVLAIAHAKRRPGYWADRIQ